jgi:hypothetical protein
LLSPAQSSTSSRNTARTVAAEKLFESVALQSRIVRDEKETLISANDIAPASPVFMAPSRRLA